VSRRRKIELCPQHSGGKSVKPTYLLRTCPSCMKWLGEHPAAASIVTWGTPGAYRHHPRVRP